MRRLPVPNLLTLALVVLLLANYFGTFSDLDFTWQVRTGEQIAHTGPLRVTESFTYTIAGQQLPDFEWLYEVLLWSVWSWGGYGGLRFLKMLLVAAPLVVLALRLHRDGIRWHGIATACFLAVAVLFPGWNLRPMVCTTLGLLLVSGWLHDHCTGKGALTWWLPVVMLLWANLHPGVITGQGLLAGAIAWEWLNRWLKLNKPLDVPTCRRLTLVGGLGLVATLVCPDPLERLHYTFRPELRHPIMRIFAEMQPLYTFAGVPPYTTNLAYVLAAVVGLTVALRFRQYRLWEIALLAGLTLLANAAYRSLADWVLVMLALGVPHVAALLRQAAWARRRHEIIAPAWKGALRIDRLCKRAWERPMLRFQAFWPAAVVAGLALASALPAVAWRMPMPATADWPVAAGEWIAAHDKRGNFFAQPNYGAYLGWRRGEAAKIYADTRGFFFPPYLLEDAMYVPQLQDDWRGRLTRILNLGTDYFLLETTEPANKLWLLLKPHVGTPLYGDHQTVLLSADQVRRGLAQLDAEALSANGTIAPHDPTH